MMESISQENIDMLGKIQRRATVEAITTDSWCDSWCLLCLETLGADTSWPVSVNSL